MTYQTRKVTLLSTPVRVPITSNEFKFNNVGLAPVFAHNGQHTQRTTVYLKNPDYLVEFEIALTDEARPGVDTIDKYVSMFTRRMQLGQQERAPVLGITECPARVDLVTEADLDKLPKPPEWNEDLSISFFGTDWNEGINYFYPLEIIQGVLKYPTWKEVKAFGVTKPLWGQAS